MGDNMYLNLSQLGIDGTLCIQTPETDYNDGTPIDDMVLELNIFDNIIYYIKFSDDYETYEVYTCNLSGEEKTLIGTIPTEIISDLYNFSVAEEFVVIYGEDRETEERIAYMMWLDDGRCKKLW